MDLISYTSKGAGKARQHIVPELNVTTKQGWYTVADKGGQRSLRISQELVEELAKRQEG
jgi:hypothetical protein